MVEEEEEEKREEGGVCVCEEKRTKGKDFFWGECGKRVYV